MDGKIALTIPELTAIGPLGRAKIMDEIHRGNLPAKCAGNRFIVLRDDFDKYLRALPPVNPRPIDDHSFKKR